MKAVWVNFVGGSTKQYVYLTNLNLMDDGVYNIVADGRTIYNNPVKILFQKDVSNSSIISGDFHLRTITHAKIVQAPDRPDHGIKKMFINPKKKTTVIWWKDGTKTKVKCQDGENFDVEKGVALCYMKKFFNNRGCYNEILKEAIRQSEEVVDE